MNKLDYTPENPAEELFELVGRIKAFAAYVNSTKYSIEREICASMLGLNLRRKHKMPENTAILKWIDERMENFDLEFTNEKEALVTDESGNTMLLKYDSNTKQVYAI